MKYKVFTLKALSANLLIVKQSLMRVIICLEEIRGLNVSNRRYKMLT